MGKWIFITFLLVIFSDLSAGRNNAAAASPAPLVANHTASFTHASYKAVVVPPGSCRDLVKPILITDGNCFAGLSQVLSPVFYIAESSQRAIVLQKKQNRIQAPVFKDHFHHLFPFFHFW